MESTYTNHIYTSNKFKTASLEVVFSLPFEKDTVTYLNVIKNIILNNFGAQIKLKETYDTSVYGVVNRIGNTIILELVLDFIDPKYTEDYIDKIFKVFFNMILNPIINEETLKESKNKVSEEIDSLNDNIMDVSILESLKKINKNKPFSYNLSGDEEILNKITLNNIKKFYLKLIDKSYKDIYVISSLNEKKIENTIKKYALFNSIVNNNFKYYLNNISFKKANKNHINIDYIGTNLVMIYSFSKLSEYETNYVTPILNMIWGGSYLENKLFKALRMESQICYNVTSIYQKYDRLIIVHASLSKEKYNDALKICKNVFKNLKNDIKKEDIDKSVKTMINSLTLTKDNLYKTINNYMFENMNLIDNLDERIDNYNKVSLDDVLKVIKKIKPLSINKVGE